MTNAEIEAGRMFFFALEEEFKSCKGKTYPEIMDMFAHNPTKIKRWEAWLLGEGHLRTLARMET